MAFNLRNQTRPYKGLQGGECLNKILKIKPATVLDIGSGEGIHAEKMRSAGIDVTTISMIPPADYVGDFMTYEGPKVDCVWSCHVIEHVRNVGSFLDKCRHQLNEGGLLAVTVPPAKSPLVGGHINLFTMGTLCYSLILAGFKPEMIGSYGYNLSAICTVHDSSLDSLIYDNGDLSKIAHLFPVPVSQNCDGMLEDFAWH